MATIPASELKSHARRVTGSADVPLNAQGRKEAKHLGARVKGKFDHVYTSPRDRARDTALEVDKEAAPASWLDAWKLGEHEGKPAGAERSKIDERIQKRPHVPPGKSEHSGEAGESFHQFRRRVIAGFQKQIAGMKDGKRILDVTHGRNLRVIDSWLKNGSPKDGSVHMGHMLKEGDWSKTAQLFRATKSALIAAEDAEKHGIYLARHGATNWNSSG